MIGQVSFCSVNNVMNSFPLAIVSLVFVLAECPPCTHLIMYIIYIIISHLDYDHSVSASNTFLVFYYFIFHTFYSLFFLNNTI